MELKKIKTQSKKEIQKARDLKELDNIYKKYLGKKGEITLALRSLKDLPFNKRKRIGKEANLLKRKLEKDFFQKKTELESRFLEKQLKEERVDITQPGKKIKTGYLHPLTLVFRKTQNIFQSIGFSRVEGPEIETQWYNFDALNMPPNHPARDVLSLGKTFFLKGNKVMRSQTSSVQVRYMERNSPPLRIIVIGRAYRYEATDASHEFQLHQIEGLMVDKRGKISVANFKAVIEEFFNKFFSKKTKTRLRPSYFPFTEPSFEVDVVCPICEGRGCPTCQNSGWLELGGAGMVHPNVFKNAGLNPLHWQGFAFGIGADRLAMIKYKINDIRLFHSGDLRFLNQF